MFIVPADDPGTGEKEGGVNGESVDFYINGVLGDSAVFAVGGLTNLNLNVVLAEYVLTVTSSDGGSVTDPGEGNFTRFQGTVVNLLAETDAGFKFVDWTGDGMCRAAPHGQVQPTLHRINDDDGFDT